MNKLIIIGNGFDLAHGLPTRYSDFAFWLIKETFSKLSTEGYQEQNGSLFLEDELFSITSPYSSINLDRLSDLPNLFPYCKDQKITIKCKNSFIESIFDYKNNKHWMDIESEYYFEVLRIYEEFIKSAPVPYKKVKIDSLNNLNDSFERIKNNLIKYLKSTLIEDVNQDPEIRRHFNAINQEDEKIPSSIMILVFNYTQTIEQYKEVFDPKKTTIKYIHGRLDNIAENPIIFGYGDEMDPLYRDIERLNNNEFLKNFKSFGYFKTNIYQSVSRFLEQTPFKVYIMGHSCGLSDRILLNSIFEHKNCRRIKLFFHQIDKDNNDYAEKTMDISRHFQEKKRMRNIISPQSNSFPLKAYQG